MSRPSHEVKTRSFLRLQMRARYRSFTVTYPFTARVVGAPRMTSQLSFLHFAVLHCPMGHGELQACRFPDVVFPPLFLSAFVFFLFSLCLARWFWPDLMNGRHVHTTSVCISLRKVRGSSCGPLACWILERPSSLVTWFCIYRKALALAKHVLSSIRPDTIHCGRLGSKHQLTNKICPAD